MPRIYSALINVRDMFFDEKEKNWFNYYYNYFIFILIWMIAQLAASIEKNKFISFKTWNFNNY